MRQMVTIPAAIAIARDRKVLQDLLAKLALPAQLDRLALKAHKASKDPSVLKAKSESRGRLALWDRRDQLPLRKSPLLNQEPSRR
jgi:hypothetical protein